MPFENRRREIDENVGSQGQSIRKKSMTEIFAQDRLNQERLQNMLKDAENGPSSSSNERLNGARAAVERNGRTAPGSEIPLTGQGLSAGMDRQQVSRNISRSSGQRSDSSSRQQKEVTSTDLLLLANDARNLRAKWGLHQVEEKLRLDKDNLSQEELDSLGKKTTELEDEAKQVFIERSNIYKREAEKSR